MPRRRDVDAFDERAWSYESGWLGRLHHDIAERSIEIALAEVPTPVRVLDVGCGTGYLLRLIARRCVEAEELAGVDPAMAMIEVARAVANDARLAFTPGVGAEHLPFGEDTFDLVVATTSFDHWSNQRAGLVECARVLVPGGRLVLADQFSLCYVPTTAVGRRGRVRTTRRATRLLADAGFGEIEWRHVRRPLIKAAIAAKTNR